LKSSLCFKIAHQYNNRGTIIVTQNLILLLLI